MRKRHLKNLYRIKGDYKYLLSSTLIIILFCPVTSYATGPGAAVSFFIGSAFMILISNFLKLLTLKHLVKVVISRNTFIFVTFSEIALIIGAYFPLIWLLVLLRLFGMPATTDHLESVGMNAWAVSFAVCAILPNFMLFKEKYHKFKEVVCKPKNLVLAVLMSFISPTLCVLLIFLY